MRILGIDPGLATVGLGLVDTADRRTCTAADWLVISTPAGLPLAQRLEEISSDLAQYIREHKPDLAVIEKLFFATNQKTAIDVAQARGAIMLTVQQCGVPIIEATPLELKLAIAGDGKADKRQMQDMVMRLLKLQDIPQPDDAADGLALALFGAYARELSTVSSPVLSQ